MEGWSEGGETELDSAQIASRHDGGRAEINQGDGSGAVRMERGPEDGQRRRGGRARAAPGGRSGGTGKVRLHACMGA